MKFAENRKFDVIALGRSTCDVYSLEIGDLKDSATFARYIGGSPANTATAMAKLKLKVGFIGKVSDDGMGQFIVQAFDKHGIDTSHMLVDHEGHLTGITIGEIKPAGKCACIMYRENVADLFMKPEEMDPDYIGSTKVLLISGTSLSHSPAREAVFKAIAYAHARGTKVLFDPDFREGTWDDLGQASIYLALAVSQADIVIGTEDEMRLLYKGFSRDETYSNKLMADTLLSHRPECVVIKEGKQGSTAYDADGAYTVKAFHQDKVLKTFGAGDSFASGFVHALLQGKDLSTCQKEGAAAAAITITGHSCSEAAPTLEALETFLSSH